MTCDQINNYFTKEELESIKNDIGKSSFSYLFATEEDYQKIREKAQSMIDNMNIQIK